MGNTRRFKIYIIIEFLKLNDDEFNLMYCSAEYLSASLNLTARTTRIILKELVKKNLLKFQVNREAHPKRYPLKFYTLKTKINEHNPNN